MNVNKAECRKDMAAFVNSCELEDQGAADNTEGQEA